ncbi:hypothetical protein ACU4GD_03060 [Cupriavidus basilensis]
MSRHFPAHGGTIGDKIRSAFAVGGCAGGMLALVFFATTLNYIDRAALGVMQPVLAKAMNWSSPGLRQYQLLVPGRATPWASRRRAA